MCFLPEPTPYTYPLGAPDLRKTAEGLGADAYDVQQPADFAPAWDARCAAPPRPATGDRRESGPEVGAPYWSPPFWQKAVD